VIIPRPDLKDFPPTGNYLRRHNGVIYEIPPGTTIAQAKEELKRIEKL
jgi:hypothetical protein